MAARSWKFHSSRALLVILLTLLVGWLAGHMALAVATGAGAFLAWQMFNSSRLYAWLKNPEQEVPQSHGIWAEIFDGLRALDQHRRKQESRYKSMIAEFQSLTNALPDATLVIDAHDNIAWCNDTAVALLGLRIPEDLGQAVTNLLRDPDFAHWLATENRAKNRLEMPSPLNDNRWWHVTAVPFQQDQWLIVLRDITERHNLEQVRRDFVANISHELRTPVTVFLGYLELLQNHPEPEVSSAVERMQTQARNMKSLLDDLLELSRLQSDEIQGEVQEIDIPAMVEQLKEQAEEISGGRHSLEFDVQPGLHLSGVASDLESAFRNLIINAIRYTPEHGRIMISWLDSPDGPCFAVKDTGIGIPKRDLPRLTERFYRVGSDRARQSGGTGLGLAIVKHVLNAHKANLVIRSELGEGSEFICQFPNDRRVPGHSGLPV
jgi:two-component system phosphate regulon sensor histidine kinase PhoR